MKKKPHWKWSSKLCEYYARLLVRSEYLPSHLIENSLEFLVKKFLVLVICQQSSETLAMQLFVQCNRRYLFIISKGSWIKLVKSTVWIWRAFCIRQFLLQSDVLSTNQRSSFQQEQSKVCIESLDKQLNDRFHFISWLP